jgi:hypothetical protein
VVAATNPCALEVELEGAALSGVGATGALSVGLDGRFVPTGSDAVEGAALATMS